MNFSLFFRFISRRKIDNSHTNLNKIGGSGGSGSGSAGESHQLQQREKKMNAGVAAVGLDPKSSASSSSSTSSNVADDYSCIYYSSSGQPGAVAATVNALNNLNTTTDNGGNMATATAASVTTSSSNANITISNNLINMSQVDQAESQDFSTQKFDNDDLVTLNNLNETIVLDELKQRFSKNQIYVSLSPTLS